MKQKKGRFTNEFKMEAVKLVTEQGYSQAEAAKSLGIDAKNLSRWIKEGRQEKLLNKGKERLTVEQKGLVCTSDLFCDNFVPI